MESDEVERKRIEHVRLQSAYKSVFADPTFESGQLILADLLKRGHVHSPVLANTQEQTLINAAEQSFVLNIITFSEIPTEKINQLHKDYVRNKHTLL